MSVFYAIPPGNLHGRSGMNDSRVQRDNPYEPLFTAGAFHIEQTTDGWGVYDAYMGRIYLYFATDSEAIDACVELARAGDVGVSALNAEYERQLTRARASFDEVAS